MVNFLSKLLDIRGKRGYNISNLPLLGGCVVWFPRWCGCWRGVFFYRAVLQLLENRPLLSLLSGWGLFFGVVDNACYKVPVFQLLDVYIAIVYTAVISTATNITFKLCFFAAVGIFGDYYFQK